LTGWYFERSLSTAVLTRSTLYWIVVLGATDHWQDEHTRMAALAWWNSCLATLLWRRVAHRTYLAVLGWIRRSELLTDLLHAAWSLREIEPETVALSAQTLINADDASVLHLAARQQHARHLTRSGHLPLSLNGEVTVWPHVQYGIFVKIGGAAHLYRHVGSAIV